MLPPPGTELPPDFETSCGGTITADSTVQGQWTKDCNSETPAPGHGGSGARLARYYTFTLTESADVSVILESQGAETVLYLREGTGVRSGEPIESNEGDSEYNYRLASIQRSLNAGTYTIEATTYTAGETGSFTLTVSVAGGTAPPPVTGDCDIAPIATDGSPQKGAWANDCRSEVTADRNARYYTFTLDAAAGVAITLDSDDGDDEPVLHLREGDSKTGTQRAFNDGLEDHGYTRAQIVVEVLEAGTYTIEARTYSEGYEGAFTLTVSVAGGTGTKQTVVFSDLGWNSVQIQNYIAQYIVENGYDYSTDSVPGSSVTSLTALRRGDTHVTMEIWLPNQSSDWEEGLAAGEVISLGSSLGSDWESAFVIPAYLQEQYPELDSVDDLKEEQYKSLFAAPETGGKARLVSCVVGWVCEGINREQVAGYGLNEHVHITNPDSIDALYASLNEAYQRQEPWLGYMWGTADSALLLDLVRLEEPPYSDECWETTKACGYENHTVVIGAHSGLPDLAPDVAEFLRNWDFPLDPHLKSVVRWQEANPDGSIEDTALYWLRNNEDTWSGWVTSEAAAGIRSALSES